MKKATVLFQVAMFVLAACSPMVAAAAGDDAFEAAGALQTHMIDVYERVAPAVVSINVSERVYDRQTREVRQEQGRGSGFFYDGQGHVITNYHVVEGANEVSVVLADGRVYQARLVGADPINDLAVLAVEGADDLPTPIPFTDSDQLQVGQFVLAIGSPFGLEQTLSTGVISALGRVLASPEENQVIDQGIQTDAAIYPGSSGGPLLDLQGRLIGVNSQVAGPSQVPIGFGFAVSSNKVRRVADRIIREPTGVKKSVLMLTHPYPAKGYQKLQALASANGIDLQVFDGHTREEFLVALKEAASGAVIYAAATAYKEDLLELDAFVQRGGRVLLTYNDMWQIQNAVLQELFGVSVAAETVKNATDGQRIELQSMLPSHMAGLEVSARLTEMEVSTDASQETVVGDLSVWAYLNTSVAGGERGYLASEESGLGRLTYLELPDRSIIFWPSFIYAGFPAGPGFYDDCIEDSDNEQAALALLNHLVE